MIPRNALLNGLSLASAALAYGCLDARDAPDRANFWADSAPIEVAGGHGRRGPWRMNESEFDYVDDPTVAIAGDGHVAVAWVDQKRRDAFIQIYTPAGDPRFSQAVRISSTPDTFSWLPRLVVTADDAKRIYALWQEIVFSGGSHGGEIFFARSIDGGATFGSPLNLSNSIAGDGKGRLSAERWDNGSLDLAVGPHGHVYAAWTEYEGRLWVSRSIDGGTTFSKPVHVAGHASRAARAPALAMDARGDVHLAWSDGDADAAHIRVATSRDGGQSFAPPQLVASDGHADAPGLAVDLHGSLHLAFGERVGGRPYGIRYARRDAGSACFSTPRTIARGKTGMGGENFPDLGVDAVGHVYVVWKSFPASGAPSHGLRFTMSRDRGRTFAEPEVVPGSADPSLGFGGGLQGALGAKLAVNAGGALALVNATFAPGRFSRIRLWLKPSATR